MLQSLIKSHLRFRVCGNPAALCLSSYFSQERYVVLIFQSPHMCSTYRVCLYAFLSTQLMQDISFPTCFTKCSEEVVFRSALSRSEVTVPHLRIALAETYMLCNLLGSWLSPCFVWQMFCRICRYCCFLVEQDMFAMRHVCMLGVTWKMCTLLMYYVAGENYNRSCGSHLRTRTCGDTDSVYMYTYLHVFMWTQVHRAQVAKYYTSLQLLSTFTHLKYM